MAIINSAKPSLYVSDGTMTVQGICKSLSTRGAISVSDFLAANAYDFYQNNEADCKAYEEYMKLSDDAKASVNILNYSFVTRLFIFGASAKKTISPSDLVNTYLQFCHTNNLNIVTGLVFSIPYKNNGGVRETGTYLLSNTGIPKMLTNRENLNTVKALTGIHWKDKLSGANVGLQGTLATTHSSYFQRIEPGEKHTLAYLPVIPQEFSDSNSATWSSVSMMGRSVDYQIYSGSSRTVSFTLQLHQELYNDTVGTTTDNIYNLVQLIESCNYPFYSSNNWAGPPQVVFKIGEQFYIKGILESCTTNWKAPFDDKGRYMCCDLSVSVKETTGPYSALDIGQNAGAGLGGYRKG